MTPGEEKEAQSSKAHRIVGGLFGLECGLRSQGHPPPFLSKRDVFLANARSGIWLLIHLLRPHHVWVPSYLCHTILGAIDTSRTALRYYEVDASLNIPSDDWLREVISGDLVIFIDYFGFSYDRRLGDRVKEKAAWVLEDASQALLTGEVGRHSDFALFSLRKWIGVPDGGILRLPEGFPSEGTDLEPPQVSWWLKAFHARVLRREFDEGLPTRSWFELFRETEDAGPTGPYAMSQLTRAIFEFSVDYSVIAEKRRDNYRALLEGLADFAIYPRLDSDVVPLGFPVRTADRDRIRQALCDHEIYPPVHWLLDGIVPSRYQDSHQLARSIMTLPCDQRYSTADMERVVRIFMQQAALHR